MSNVARFDALRSLVYSSITNSYTALGGPLLHSMRALDFTNDTDALIYLSFDGTTDNIPFPSLSFRVYDITSDQDERESFRYQKGTQLFIKYVGTAPTNNPNLSNTFFTTSFYGKGE